MRSAEWKGRIRTMNIVPPVAEGPEKSVLSSLLRDERMLARARAEGLTEEHFGVPAHAGFYRYLLDRTAAGKSLELVALVTDLQAGGMLEELGGPAAVTGIYTYAPNSAHWESHVEILRDFLARRRALAAASAIAEHAVMADGATLSQALRDATEATSAALAERSGLLTAQEAVKQLLAEMMDTASKGTMPGLSTGMGPLDEATGGMRAGELWVMAAEPSGGKSVAMLQATAAVLREGKRVLVISLEMGAAAVISRLTACSASLPYEIFTHPRRATAGMLVRAKQALEEMSAAPLTIHDGGGLSFDRIAGIARAESDRHGGLDLVVVDYLQLVEGARRRRDETREQEVAAVSRGLKGLAKALGCPVLTASQLNDQGRLRESRAIGQDADVVLYLEEDGIHAKKVRNGTRGEVFPMVLNGRMQRFERTL
jgi:replicative DNA helicase